ncbi:MAG: hypothetical protein ACR2OH_02685 [Microthrixaceae bacterium]
MEEVLLPPSEAPAFDASASGASTNADGVVDLMPPSDSEVPDAAAQQRADVDSMVERCLDGAIGLACRSLDPDGLDAQGADVARQLVMRSISDVAQKKVSADDETVRAVMRRTAELAMDALVAHQGSAVPGDGIDLAELLPTGVDPGAIAPAGRLRYAVIQDTLAASRATDRQVAYTTLAASVPVADACTLLGIEEDELRSALLRIGRRLGETQPQTGPAPAEAAG